MQPVTQDEPEHCHINTYELYRPKFLFHVGPRVATCTEIDLADYGFRTSLEAFVTYFRTRSEVSCITDGHHEII